MPGIEHILGESSAITKVRDLIGRIANSNVNLLLAGENGTGKELVAKAIHGGGKRNIANFVPVICSTLSERDWTTQLFKEAHNGTIFFDEIGDMPLPLQAKLARTLEEYRAGRAQPAKSTAVDVRIISSTAMNLKDAIKTRRFSSALYYRLNPICIELPPLRDRGNDIALLVKAFLDKYSHEYSKPVKTISQVALSMIENYSWPGNVRELDSVMEGAVSLCQSDQILPSDLPGEIQQVSIGTEISSPTQVWQAADDDSPARTLQQVEEEYIRWVLKKTNGNHVHAARLLGIDRRTLYRKLEIMGDNEEIE